MIFAAQRTEVGLLGADGCRVGLGLAVSRLLHHQKPPPPSNATKTMPMIATLIAQRIASLAIRKKDDQQNYAADYEDGGETHGN